MISAKVIADSIAPNGQRITTIQATHHRYILAEFNTHRAFCLAGDTELYFRLPATGNPYRIRIDEFVDKWHNGASPRPNKPRRTLNLKKIDPESLYTARQVTDILGTSNLNIGSAASSGALVANKFGREWQFSGSSFINYWNRPNENRQDIRYRLNNMLLDQAAEDDLSLAAATVADCIYSGCKNLYEVTVGSKKIKTSEDHLFFTQDGWKRLGDLCESEKVAIQMRGKPSNEHVDKYKFKRINGRWVNQWMREIKPLLDGICPCGARAEQGHHVIPVHARPDLAFDLNNIVHLCKECHHQEHVVQGWQTGVPNYIDFLPIKRISSIGEGDTYDISVAGKFPNFIANGFVVHNSRNSASSRAIPVKKLLETVRTDPAMPLYYAYNQAGMQAAGRMTEAVALACEQVILDLRDKAISAVATLTDLNLHKQWANRYLEPWMHHTVIVTSTEWDNFFAQRISALAQPEIDALAIKIFNARLESQPTLVNYGEWHLPYITEDDRLNYNMETLVKASAARCARVSYLTQDGVPKMEADLDRYNRLVTACPPHWSPLEHVATPWRPKKLKFWTKPLGNFDDWAQLRHNTLRTALSSPKGIR